MPDGTANGVFERVAADGTVLVSGGFVAGLADGTWIYRVSTGVVTQEAHYDRGLPHGTWSWFEGTTRVARHQFAYGKACGLWEDLDPGSGTPLERDYGFCDDTPPATIAEAGKPAPMRAPAWDRLSCPAGTTLAPPDPLDTRRAACLDTDGRLHGPWSRTGPAHTITIEGQYAHGLKSGPQARWYDTGSLSELSSFVDDQPDGTRLGWREDGTPIAAERWVRGVREGEAVTYYRDGKRASQGGWSGGARVGVWTWWFESGIEARSETYAAGILQGAATTHFENGHLASEGAFAAGLAEGTWKRYWSWGVLREEGHWSAGLESGRFQTFSPLGEPDSDGPWVDGLRNGTWMLWTYLADAVIRETGELRDGKYEGLGTGVYEPEATRFSETHYANDLR